MPLIFLDSNIYRQIGIKFNDNIDYKNLSKILETSGNEFGLLEVVHTELMDYYKNDIFNAILNDHETIYKRYQANPYLTDIDIPETTNPLLKAIQLIDKDLRDNKYYWTIPTISTPLLLQFLLDNKRQSKKDNTRDFIIFISLIELCKSQPEDYAVLISNDNIFSTNDFFKKLLVREGINNLKAFGSISDFLKDFGPKLDYIDNDFVLKLIDRRIIEKELLSDIKCLPTYISEFYFVKGENDLPEIESLEIINIAIHNYYVVKDYSTNKLKINISLNVKIKAIYQPEQNADDLKDFLSKTLSWSTHQNLFDKKGRLIFDNSVLFIFEGEIDANKKMVDNLNYINFIPDYFIDEERHNKYNPNSILVDRSTCDHLFENTQGFWKYSQLGGGLSWHLRCANCGQLRDTGEFYE